MLTPVRRLAQAAERMSGGDLSVRVQPRGRDELARLVASFNEMARGLEGKVAELQRMEASSARARSEGSGLGLAIAWENARLHGGRIDAGNHPDGGAVFTVILPVRGLIAAGMTAGTLPGIRR